MAKIMKFMGRYQLKRERKILWFVVEGSIKRKAECPGRCFRALFRNSMNFKLMGAPFVTILQTGLLKRALFKINGLKFSNFDTNEGALK